MDCKKVFSSVKVNFVNWSILKNDYFFINQRINNRSMCIFSFLSLVLLVYCMFFIFNCTIIIIQLQQTPSK